MVSGNKKPELMKLLAAVINSNGDIKTFALQHSIKKPTLYRYFILCLFTFTVKIPIRYIKQINSDTETPKHGGRRFQKVTEAMKNMLIELIETNPLITLREMKSELQSNFNVSLSLQCISGHLDGMAYSVKKVRVEPAKANEIGNKKLRKAFVEKILSVQSNNTPIVYMDETNFNIYISRTEGRSKVGERCNVKFPNSKGKNVHLIGAIGPNGFKEFQLMRGSFTNESANDFVRSVIRKARDHYNMNVCIVIDNAPCHSRVENILNESEFYGSTILRLGPYSPMLNPIEQLWSSVKSVVKSDLAKKMPEILQNVGRGEESIENFRLRILEG